MLPSSRETSRLGSKGWATADSSLKQAWAVNVLSEAAKR